jgi:hypothetical protein
MNIDLNEIASKYNLRKRGGGFAGPCPKCGGGASSDKFVLKLDGGFKCYSCDFKGDAITWLREIEGKSCPEAHEAAGIDCRAASCPARGTCRLGDGSGKVAKKARSLAPVPARKVAQVAVTVSRTPAEVWTAWASGLVAQAIIDLREQQEHLAWLAGRGIVAAAVQRFALGWLGHDRRVMRQSIGLAPKEGKDKLWVPGGLLIPIFADAGGLLRLRIRRTPESRERFLSDRKYMWVEGSGTDPLVIRPSTGPARGVVVVEAELDAMAVASAHPGVMVIALGTVAGGLPGWLRDECAAAPAILVALDADQDRDGKVGAGPQAIASWTNTFRQARFWPVPVGKDPGDYVKDHGGDLRAWIDAGLPPREATVKESLSTASSLPHAQPLPLDAGQRGEGGKELLNCKDGAGDGGAATPMAEFIEWLRLENGWIWRNASEVVVRYQRPQVTTAESMGRREKVRGALYGAGEVASLLELLPAGTHSHGGLMKFFKGA